MIRSQLIFDASVLIRQKKALPLSKICIVKPYFYNMKPNWEVDKCGGYCTISAIKVPDVITYLNLKFVHVHEECYGTRSKHIDHIRGIKESARVDCG